MTTKKTTKDGVKKTTKKQNTETVDNQTTTTTAAYCHPEYIDPDKVKGETSTTDTDDGSYLCIWDNTETETEKRKLAKDILIRLVDFNLEQLSRTDVDKVLIYDNPAEYAAEVVNELYERIKE